ncbi:hypothetical protein GIB67_000289 [Kingdonia uniflora]|uniref:Myb/SANT-like domain-containing protein n=1 Tax=Kingdonia uniflora TaxID=39325 RepID=A0A7J7LC43_9MAGN|nr:hypothetical protein GIB67_000289 [Kingdonia uniflora]
MNDDKEVLKNRHKKLRNIYTILKALLDQSGFGWDDEKHMEHPEAKPMRTKTMPNYHDLDEICGKSTSIGQYAGTAKDLKSKKLSDVNITQVQDSSYDTTMEDNSPLVNNEEVSTMGDYDSDEEDMIVLAATVAIVATSHYYENHISKEPCRNSKLTGKEYIVELVDGNPIRMYENLCLDKLVFKKQCDILTTEGSLRDTRS